MMKAELPCDNQGSDRVGLVLALHKLRKDQSLNTHQLCNGIGVNSEELSDLLSGREVSLAVSVRARTYLLDAI